MKKVTIISVLILGVTIAMISCNGKRSPGSIYMPDMAYSRTIESYAQQDSAFFTSNPFDKGGNKIYFNAMPPAGTIKRGEMFPYTLPNDSNGYKMSAAVPNPVTVMSGAEMSEAGRLYNVNCGICHGEKAAGNGPIADKIGAVANLTQDLYKGMADGTMFHVVTYGKGNMGSYASQLTREQRWKVIKYVRTLQGTGKPAATDSMSVAKAAPLTADTATKK